MNDHVRRAQVDGDDGEINTPLEDPNVEVVIEIVRKYFGIDSTKNDVATTIRLFKQVLSANGSYVGAGMVEKVAQKLGLRIVHVKRKGYWKWEKGLLGCELKKSVTVDCKHKYLEIQ